MGERFIDWKHVTYEGPALDDKTLLEALPEDLVTLQKQINGFILFEGGFHVRGACTSPEWHSLRAVWHGKDALHQHYRNVVESDIPFAQEATGDQFLLRSGSILRLWSETGEVDELGEDLWAFLEAVVRDPVETLSMQPFLEFRREGGELLPGELLSVMPPFCVAES